MPPIAREDHPRSRGVYAEFGRIAARFGGSSPLARGLPARTTTLAWGGRIIPARAGFTEPGSSPVHGTEDHPRSRGVYRRRRYALAGSHGSSPLARGLPSPRSPAWPHGGIIPARAGFTNSAPGPGGPGWDHPRSRGVYRVLAPHCTEPAGSSPLARGLRRRGAHPPVGRRIIPARAGFTGGTIPEGEAGWDHPRSRGVYVVGRRGGHRRWRIIPARAGFTAGVRAPAVADGDHPRSRGVYLPPSTIWRPTRGSSPLARGLQGRGRLCPIVHVDHPRSRGVYSPGQKMR